MSDFETLTPMIGAVMLSVRNEDNEYLRFQAADGREFLFYHLQDCCETVRIEEIVGNLDDLVGSPILQAECASSPEGQPPPEYPDSWTWTFYKFATVKGYVTVRWLGRSNGYYSERVSFCVDGQDQSYI